MLDPKCGISIGGQLNDERSKRPLNGCSAVNGGRRGGGENYKLKKFFSAWLWRLDTSTSAPLFRTST